MDDLAHYLSLVPMLKERFEAASHRYVELAAAVRPRIARSEWTDGERYSLEPLHFELAVGVPPGKPFWFEPRKKRSGIFRYGFSASGEILLEEQHTNFPGWVYECFRERNEAGPCATLYDYHPAEKACINVEQLFVVDGVARAFIRFAAMGMSVSVFDYEGQRVARIHQHSRMHDPLRPDAFTRELTVRYDDGKVWQVDATYDDGRTERLLERGERL